MQRTRSYLYDRFRNGQKPDEDDFRDLIDSNLNLQDDTANAGWYYFRFLPLAGTSTASVTSHTVNPEFHVDQQRTYTGLWRARAYDGYMNIPIPRGVTRINQVAINAYFDIRESVGPDLYLRFSLLSLPHDIGATGISRGILFNNMLENSPGLHEINQQLPVEDGAIDSQEEALYLRVLADPQADRNSIAIRLFGIQYAV